MKFSYISKYLDDAYYEYSEKHQILEMVALGLLGFMLPFAIGAPQIIIGILVNALIIRSALSLPSYKTLPVIFTPSIGAIAQGALFGPLNVFLIFMMPFIWSGNLILLYAFKAKIAHGYNYLLTLLAGSAAKAGFLFLAAYILYSASMIPEVFLSSMGVMQFVTAFLGGIMAYAQLKAEKYF
jgi:hypothetical protein